MEHQRVVRSDQHGIVPTAGTDDGPFRGTSLIMPYCLVGGSLYLSQVFLTDWQVCGVNP